MASADSYEIVEQYLKNKYLPSYLLYAEYRGQVIHIQVATEVESDSVTIITAYRPTLDKWEKDFRTRRKQ